MVGLGYVGLPIAVSFAKKVKVIGFDINKDKIDLYKKGIDPTKEIYELDKYYMQLSIFGNEKSSMKKLGNA